MERDGADKTTETLVIPYIWAQIEPSLAIICASVLTYKPLLRDMRLRFGFASSPQRDQPNGSDRTFERLPPRHLQNSRPLSWSLTTFGHDTMIQTLNQERLSGRTEDVMLVSPRRPILAIGSLLASSHEDELGSTIFAPAAKPEPFA